MIGESAVIVLAAGSSTRFGGEKLLAPIEGKAMARHVLDLIGAFRFARKIAVVRPDLPELMHWCHGAGVETLINDSPQLGLSHSLKLGVAAIADMRAALVLLADMPFVTLAHIETLFAHFDEAAGGVASSRLGVFTPPVILGRSLFADVQYLAGDRGARDLLSRAPLVEGDADMLRDIDERSQMRG